MLDHHRCKQGRVKLVLSRDGIIFSTGIWLCQSNTLDADKDTHELPDFAKYPVERSSFLANFL